MKGERPQKIYMYSIGILKGKRKGREKQEKKGN